MARRGLYSRDLCCLVLEHIRDLDAVLAEMATICRPGGFVLISELHPAMFLRRLQARFTDTKTGLKVNIESYRHQVADYGASRGTRRSKTATGQALPVSCVTCCVTSPRQRDPTW